MHDPREEVDQSKKYVIPDRKYWKWDDRCQHEINWKTGRVCNKLLDEDTGECPLKHGKLLHDCKTECCGIFVAGNHNFCKYHRKAKLKSICKTQEKISREYRKRMWGKNAKMTGLDLPEDRKDFNDWSQKQLEKTYDKEVLKLEKEEENETHIGNDEAF